VAYDEQIAMRIRAILADEHGLTEQKAFGGLAFLIGGNMAVSASSRGGVMVRVDPAESEALVATTSAAVMEMRGRRMPGWLHLDGADVGGDDVLAAWVGRGVLYARTLPPK
jgi:TfoX N-terminal domain